MYRPGHPRWVGALAVNLLIRRVLYIISTDRPRWSPPRQPDDERHSEDLPFVADRYGVESAGSTRETLLCLLTWLTATLSTSRREDWTLRQSRLTVER
jgi:hypothetical protein